MVFDTGFILNAVTGSVFIVQRMNTGSLTNGPVLVCHSPSEDGSC